MLPLHSAAAVAPGAARTTIVARHWPLALGLLVLFTLLIRAPYIGNPLIDADEQFYLLTGDRMLHGAIPYVDIWDRKPVGLFVLYAGMRLLGGNGILAYQLVAAAFVAATAVLIAMMARRIATPGAALVAALTYAPNMALSGGQGGQTPVYYNLFVAAVAWALLRRVAPRPGDPAPRLPLRWFGAGLMLLVGIAMQIKYNAVFEGVYFGFILLFLARRAGCRPGTLTIDASLWIAAAVAPTIIAYLVYVAIGHGDAFLYALGSIFWRGAIGSTEVLHNLRHDLGRLLPLLVAVLLAEGLLRRHAPWHHRPEAVRAHRFLLGWALAAMAGFLIFGTYFNHYILPLLAPLAILAAPAFAIRSRRVGAWLSGLMLLTLAVWFPIKLIKNNRVKGTAEHAYLVADRIRPLLKGRCLFIFYGEPIYYQLTNSCLLTHWPFPYHLSLTRESAALGVDPLAEMHHILAQKPQLIIDKMTPDPEINPDTQRILRDELRQNYRLIYAYTFGAGSSEPEQEQLWERLPGR